MTLKQKTFSALMWSAIERFSLQGIQFVVVIVLARLLVPKDFGLIGMLTLFIAIAQSFVNSGFGQALIQKQDANYIDECSIFYFNIMVGFFAAGILCFIAPWIAAFYNQPLLAPLTQVLSLNLIFNSFSLIQSTLLKKQINFKVLFKVGIGATLASGIIGIGMAYMGYGVWSLVAQSLSRTFMYTILLWFMTSWRPAWVLSLTSLRQMFGFGSRLLFAGIIDTIFVNIYIVVIGKLFSPSTLGYYTQAKQLQHLPVSNTCSVVSRVTFPLFSSMQNDKVKLKNNLRKALMSLVMIIFPMMIGMCVMAEPLICFIIGEKWLSSVPYLRLLCVIGVLWPLHVINLNVLNALGRSDLFLRLEILKKILIAFSISITYRWGVEAMLWGQIALSGVAYYLNSYYTNKFLNYSVAEQIKDFWPYLGATAVMGTVMWGSLLFLQSASAALSLLIGSIVGAIVYYFICNSFRLASFKEAQKLFRGKIRHQLSKTTS